MIFTMKHLNLQLSVFPNYQATMYKRENKTAHRSNVGLLLIHNDALLNKIGHLDGQPRRQAQCHGVRNTESGHVSRPQRLKVIGQTDLAAAVHFRRFAVQLGQSDLRCGCRIRDGNLSRRIVSTLDRAYYLKQYLRTLTSNSTPNSYLSMLCMNQHLPNHLVPSLFDSRRNQSLPASLLFCTYFLIKMKWLTHHMKGELSPTVLCFRRLYLDQCLVFLL